ncbi:MAG: hypothetical protein H6719_24590 [Sandaracinaceae bacterium]|nr:hypothetical protein [Sandaracinaceae bacterium]
MTGQPVGGRRIAPTWRALGAVVGLVLATAWALTPGVAHATLSEALSLDELVRQSTLVLRVTCVGERTLLDDRSRIVMDYELRVDEVVHGASRAGETVTMRRLGGELGDLGMRIEGEPSLTPGSRYVVFLYAVNGLLRPVGMSQGVLPVSTEAGALVVHPGGAGLALVQRGGGGQLVPAPPALLHPEPWERLRERLDAVRGAP